MSTALQLPRRTDPWRQTLRFGLAALPAVILSGCQTTPVPTDPITSGCTASSSEINTWFESGAVSLNGVVKPADSVNFPDTPNCSFYKWSEQMFLWLNSPAPPSYGGGGGRLFKSPAFYDVSPLDATLDRTLIAHSSLLPITLNLRAAQVGRQGLPVILDRTGTILEVVPPVLSPAGRPILLDGQGQRVEIARFAKSDSRTPRFFTTDGKAIEGVRPLIDDRIRPELVVQKLTFDKTTIFLNPSGLLVEPEQGQADGSVLMAQGGSLVYYEIAVNDVYAYFLTGAKNGAITPGTHFPTTQAELNQVTTYAAAHGKPSFPDPEALAIEIKTAWVEASKVLHPETYITMNASIPTYDESNPNEWVPNGHKTAKMAMVGMHVVGSAKGHPELIWATFEHIGNAPSGTYTYTATTGPNPHTVNPVLNSPWLFCAANPDMAHLNEPHMVLDSHSPPHIVALPGFTVSPSNIIRANAWGAVPGVAPNPVSSVSSSNSELISINNAVRGMLDAADLRKNYIMTGSTWTINGGGFNSNFGNPGNPGIVTGRAVGTSQLANTSMETFQQTFPSSFNSFGNNCFSCHGSNTTSVSHIYTTPGAAPHGIKPLF